MRLLKNKLKKVLWLMGVLALSAPAARADDWADLCKRAALAVADVGEKAALEQARALGFSEEQIAYARRECRKFSIKAGRFSKTEEVRATSER